MMVQCRIRSAHRVKLRFLHLEQCAGTITARHYQSSGSSSQPAHNVFSYYLNFRPMDPDIRRQKRRDIVFSSLDVAIEASNLAKEFCSITPAKPVFASFSVILRQRLSCIGVVSCTPVFCELRDTRVNQTHVRAPQGQRGDWFPTNSKEWRQP
jgi:hypothetical protein